MCNKNQEKIEKTYKLFLDGAKLYDAEKFGNHVRRLNKIELAAVLVEKTKSIDGFKILSDSNKNHNFDVLVVCCLDGGS